MIETGVLCFQTYHLQHTLVVVVYSVSLLGVQDSVTNSVSVCRFVFGVFIIINLDLTFHEIISISLLSVDLPIFLIDLLIIFRSSRLNSGNDAKYE